MNFLRIIFLCWAVCGIHAAGRCPDGGRGDKRRIFQTLEMVGTRVKDAASCREVTEELNKEADKQEKLWREAIMSGAPTPHEWYQMAEFEMKSFKKELTDKGKNGQDKLVSLFRLEEEGVISHHEAEKAMAALRRLLLASKAAVDSLDDFIAGASLPLPSSPDGDSYEKLVAWKLDPGNSLFYNMDHDPICNGCVEKALEYCLNGRGHGIAVRNIDPCLPGETCSINPGTCGQESGGSGTIIQVAFPDTGAMGLDREAGARARVSGTYHGGYDCRSPLHDGRKKGGRGRNSHYR